MFKRFFSKMVKRHKRKLEVKAVKTKDGGLQIQYPTYEEFEQAMKEHKPFIL